MNDRTRAPGLSRRGALGLLGAGALLPLAGCGGAPGAAADGVAAGTVEFVYLGDINQREKFQQLFDRFNTQHPDIDLQASAKSGSWSQFVYAVATQIAGGRPPDIVQIATEGQQLFVSKNVLEPLDPYITADQELVDEYYDDIHDNLRTWTQRYG